MTSPRKTRLVDSSATPGWGHADRLSLISFNRTHQQVAANLLLFSLIQLRRGRPGAQLAVLIEQIGGARPRKCCSTGPVPALQYADGLRVMRFGAVMLALVTTIAVAGDGVLGMAYHGPRQSYVRFSPI